MPDVTSSRGSTFAVCMTPTVGRVAPDGETNVKALDRRPTAGPEEHPARAGDSGDGEALEERIVRFRNAASAGDHHAAVVMLSHLAKPLCDSGAVHTFLGLLGDVPAGHVSGDLRLLLRTGDAWTELAQWQQAAASYRQAHHLAAAGGCRRDLAQVLTAQGVLAWYRGDIPGARHLLDQAADLLRGTAQDDPAWDELREGSALVLSAQAELGRSEELLRTQLRAFQRRADAEGQRHVLTNTAFLVAFRRGDFDNAEALLTEAAALAQRHGLRLGAARTHNCLAFVQNWQRRPETAMEHAQRALGDGHRLGVSHIVGFAEFNQAVALQQRGETEAALRACERSLKALHSGSSSLLRADVLLTLGRLERSRNAARAEQAVRAAVDIARMQQDQWTLGVCLLELAGFGAPATARAALDEAHTVFERYGDRHQLLRWRLAAAELAHATADGEGLAGHVTALVTGMCTYPWLARPVMERLKVLLPAATAQGDRVAPPPGSLGSAWAQYFRPLAADLLSSGHEQVRRWAVTALSEQRQTWAYELLAGHRDPAPAVGSLVEDALATAVHEPLPRLELRCLGGCEVLLGGTPVPPERWVSLHAQLVLVRLVHTGGATRDELLELLWPEESPDRSEARLRTTVRLLRGALRPAWRPSANYVVHRAGRYRIPEEVSAVSDHHRFGDWIRTARRRHGEPRRHACEQAIRHYRGHFLPDLHQDWVRAERDRLRTDWLWALEEDGAALLADGRLEEAEGRARQVLDEDDLRERAWRLLLRALDGQGRRAEAVRCYRGLERRLDDELGVAPAPSTRSIADRLIRR